MASREFTIDEIMAILPETPRRIAAVADGLSPAQLRARPAPDAWSMNDVLAHLRACHDVLGGNVLRILAEDQPTWKGMNPRAWLKHTDYPTWAFDAAFEAFRRQRAQLLDALEGLAPAAWARTATVTGMLGETYARTARYYGDWLAGHERAHWAHLRRIRAVVGPA